MPSMRRRLWLALLLTLVVILVINGLLGGLVARHEVDKIFDAQLVNTSRVVQRLVDLAGPVATSGSVQLALSPLYRSTYPVPEGIRVYEKNLLIQVWDKDGADMLFRSPQCPDFAIGPLQPGFHDVESGNQSWRVFVSELQPQNSWLLVGEVPQGRNAINENLINIFIISGFLVLIMGSFLISSVVERGMKPLWYLRQSLASRTIHHLEPVTLNPVPRELYPVIEGLNQMLGRLENGMARERRFVADAAHELRTPLAVIRLAAQTAERHAAQGKDSDFKPLFSATERANHLVEQLLLLARLEQGQEYPEAPVPLDLAESTRRILADLYSRATVQADQQPEIELVFSSDDDTGDNLPVIQCHATLFEIALRNLLDNALKYGGCQVQVEIGVEDQHKPPYVWISVRDFGDGVDEDAMPQLTNAFFRNGQSDVSGAGLGLSIVCKTLQVMGGELGLRNHPDGGFEAVIRLPMEARSNHQDPEGRPLKDATKS